MTLYLKLSPTADSTVFSGDTRINDKKNVFTDGFAKATPLGKYAVGGATGCTRSLHPETNALQRDVHQFLREFFADRDVNGESVNDFLGHLQVAHDSYVSEHCGGKHIKHEGDFFSIVFSSLENGKLLDYCIKCDLADTAGLVPTKSVHVCEKGVLMPTGDPKILAAILSFVSPHLKELYDHPKIPELLAPPYNCQFGVVTTKEAIEICRFVTRVCSEQAEQITGELSIISPYCDVFLLDQNGVRQV